MPVYGHGFIERGMIWTMTVPGVSGEGTDALNGSIAGCDETLDLTATEQAATLTVVEDISEAPELRAIADSSGGPGYTNDWQVFPDAPAQNDAAYFGGAVPFAEIFTDVDTSGQPGTYTGSAINWEYWDGSSWTAQPVAYDHSGNATTDGTRPFQQDGATVIVPQPDWTKSTVLTQEAYWVRGRIGIGLGGNLGDLPIFSSVEHSIVTPADGFKCPEPATIVGCRITNENATAHTTADIKFIVMNITSGVASDEMTFLQDKRQQRFDGTDWKTGGMPVTTGDILGAIITQPDTGDELTDFKLELDVRP